MANIAMEIVFGVAGGGSLSGESGAKIAGELKQIVSSINANPFKIKVALDGNSVKSVKSQV